MHKKNKKKKTLPSSRARHREAANLIPKHNERTGNVPQRGRDMKTSFGDRSKRAKREREIVTMCSVSLCCRLMRRGQVKFKTSASKRIRCTFVTKSFRHTSNFIHTILDISKISRARMWRTQLRSAFLDQWVSDATAPRSTFFVSDFFLNDKLFYQKNYNLRMNFSNHPSQKFIKLKKVFSYNEKSRK